MIPILLSRKYSTEGVNNSPKVTRPINAELGFESRDSQLSTHLLCCWGFLNFISVACVTPVFGLQIWTRDLALLWGQQDKAAGSWAVLCSQVWVGVPRTEWVVAAAGGYRTVQGQSRGRLGPGPKPGEGRP